MYVTFFSFSGHEVRQINELFRPHESTVTADITFYYLIKTHSAWSIHQSSAFVTNRIDPTTSKLFRIRSIIEQDQDAHFCHTHVSLNLEQTDTARVKWLGLLNWLCDLSSSEWVVPKTMIVSSPHAPSKAKTWRQICKWSWPYIFLFLAEE